MKKTKIGRGYHPSAYGHRYREKPIVWLINGKAYAKDSARNVYQTDIEGYVMLNVLRYADKMTFYEVGLIAEHQQFK